MAEDDEEGSHSDEGTEMTCIIDWTCESAADHEQEDLNTSNP